MPVETSQYLQQKKTNDKLKWLVALIPIQYILGFTKGKCSNLSTGFILNNA
jgi:hypothetical protein